MLARTAGLLAHLAEEREQPIGFLMAARAEEAVEYERREAPRDARRPTSRRAPGTEQLALDDASYREPARLSLRALGVLPREARGGRGRLGRGGGRPWRRSRGSRSPRSASSARPCTPDNPFGAHLCVEPRRDRPHLLDERHHRHAELHPADRRRPRQLGHRLGAQLRGLRHRARASGSSPPTTPGRSWRARRSASFDRIGLCHIPVGTGNTERLMHGDPAAAARRRRC